MNSNLFCFFVFSCAASFAFANDSGVNIKNQFDACIKEAEIENRLCNFGGCGNIVGACYQWKINSILLSTEAAVEKIRDENCRQAAKSATEEIKNMREKFHLLSPLDGTWGGLDIQVEAVLFENKAMKILAKECERDQ